MKKLIALTLALVMCLSLGITALADTSITQETENGTGSTEVKYDVSNGGSSDNTYIVTIPASVSVLVSDEHDDDAQLVVSASDVKLLCCYNLEVYVSSANDYYLVQEDSDSSIPYYVYIMRDGGMGDDDAIYSEISGHTGERLLSRAADVSSGGARVLTVYGEGWVGEGTSCSETLYLSTTDDDINGATAAGKHADTLTFSCSLVNEM